MGTRMLNIKEVALSTGMKKSFIYARLGTSFPPGNKHGRARRWPEEHVEMWKAGKWRCRVDAKAVVNK
jgi:predicted DNA-binding transcriptional regulator AlpA